MLNSGEAAAAAAARSLVPPPLALHFPSRDPWSSRISPIGTAPRLLSLLILTRVSAVVEGQLSCLDRGFDTGTVISFRENKTTTRITAQFSLYYKKQNSRPRGRAHAREISTFFGGCGCSSHTVR